MCTIRIGGGQSVLRRHKITNTFIDILGVRDLKLILPKGTITWKSRGSQSTLNLVFVSDVLESTVVTCKPALDFEASSDHIPICTQLHIVPPNRQEQQPRPQWKKADWQEVNGKLAAKLGWISDEDSELYTQESIDQRVNAITKAIQKTIKEAIPKCCEYHGSAPIESH